MKRSLKIFSLTLALMLIFTTAFSVPSEAASVTISKVTTTDPLTGSTKSVNVAKGKNITLKTKVTANPNNASNKKVTYKSLNSKIATVNSKGVIKGIKPGKTKIVVTSKKNPKKKATINVTVMKTAVTSVSINKPSSTKIYVGDSITLKVKALGKNTSCKKLSWKSSNKSIATVSKNGTVNALKPGTVKISASAVDGSKKKATVTLSIENKPVQNPVTKTEPVNLVSVAVPNFKTVNFKLSKAKALNNDDIKIFTKALYTGTYRGALEASEITTTDNINYSITLDQFCYIENCHFIKISIPSLDGVKEAEAQYNEAVTAYEEEYIIKLKLNETISAYAGRNSNFGLCFENAMGFTSQKITGLPAGLTYKIHGNMVFLYGKPTTPGVVIATYTATDEVGNTFTKKLKFIIASETSIYATSITTYGKIPSNWKFTARLSANGGSGSYKYSFAPNANTYGCKISDNEVSGSFQTPGTYTIPIVVTDENDITLTTTTSVTFIIKQSLSIAGIVKDAEGNPIHNAHISYSNVDKADKFSSSGSVYTNENGAYILDVTPGKYNIFVSYSSGVTNNTFASKSFFDTSFTTSKSGYDFSLPIYKVAFIIPSSSTDSQFSGTWRDSNSESYGSGKYIYLKPGTYNLEASFDSCNEWYEKENITSLKASFTVTNKSITVTPTNVTAGLKIIRSIDLNMKNVISGTVKEDPYYDVYSFKSEKDCDITYHDQRDKSDISIDIYDITAKASLDSYDDSATIMCKEGHEYLIRVRQYNSTNSSFSYSFDFNVTDIY